MTTLKRYSKKDFRDAQEELDVKAREYAEKNELTYSEAVVHFLTSDPDLAERYEKDRDAPPVREYTDPYKFAEGDTPRRRHLKNYQQANETVAYLIESNMLLKNMSREDSTRLILQDPENRELIETYLEGPG